MSESFTPKRMSVDIRWASKKRLGAIIKNLMSAPSMAEQIYVFLLVQEIRNKRLWLSSAAAVHGPFLGLTRHLCGRKFVSNL